MRDDLLSRCRSFVDRLGCSPAEALALAILSFGAVLVLGLLWWLQRPDPPPELVVGAAPSPPIATPAAEQGPAFPGEAASPRSALHVHVTGEVATPGVYELPDGARVVDAIDRAGGATAEADLERVNLAVALADGVQVRVPAPGETLPPGGTVGTSAAPAAGAPTAAGPLDLNAADAAALEELPGVGPVTARKIVDHRMQIGGFRSVEQLLDIRGIGEATLAELSAHVTVGG